MILCSCSPDPHDADLELKAPGFLPRLMHLTWHTQRTVTVNQVGKYRLTSGHWRHLASAAKTG